MKLRRLLLLAAVTAVAFVGAATAGLVAQASTSRSAQTTIRVTEREFRIVLSSHRSPAGRVRLLVRNSGAYPHALAVSGPGLKAKKTAIVTPGHSAVLLVDLRSGRYALWCPVPGHAAKGMKATLTVVGGSSAPPATTTPTTDTGTTTIIPGY
jgi:hypothetical protein